MFLLLRALRGGGDIAPFLLTLSLVFLGYSGLGISLWPNVIPPDISIRDAAGPPQSLGFALVGALLIIPVILMFRAVGLSGSYFGIIMLYTAFNLAFTIWMMKSFFDELSPDVEDAARIDGSSETRVFFKICLPQVIAGLAATFVFGLILTWNEFLFALLLTGPDTRTVPVAMNQAVSSGGRGTDWTLLAAIEKSSTRTISGSGVSSIFCHSFGRSSRRSATRNDTITC
jgi:hypothetical protein